MSSRDDDASEMGSSPPQSSSKRRLEKSSSLSSDDSAPGNYSLNNNTSHDGEKPSGSRSTRQLETNETNNHHSNESDSNTSMSTEPHNPLQNGVASGSRKAKKRKPKRSRERRSSKVALMGWSGQFPNLSSTHSLESNSDLDQQQLPADLRAICATGLSVFPREVPEPEPQQQPPQPQQQLKQESSQKQKSPQPPPSPPPLLSSSCSSSSTSPVQQQKTTATTASVITSNSATTVTCTLASNTTTTSPKSTLTSNNNSNTTTTTTMSSARVCRTSEPSTEPASESEPQTDLINQKRKRLKQKLITTGTEPPAATAVATNTAVASIEDSLAASTAAASLPNKISRKRATPHPDSPSNQLENETKRIKKSEPDQQHQQDTYRGLRVRSKSLFEHNPDTKPRIARARSICYIDMAAKPIEVVPPADAAGATAAATAAAAQTSPQVEVGGTKTPARRRSAAALKLPATDPYYCLPFQYGWKRELVLRSNSSLSRQRGDVIFISPGGKKLRSREDIIPLLKGDLTIDHFCFQRQMQQVGEQYETVRQAQPAPLRRKSAAKTQQQSVPVPGPLPVKVPGPLPVKVSGPLPVKVPGSLPVPGPLLVSRPLPVSGPLPVSAAPSVTGPLVSKPVLVSKPLPVSGPPSVSRPPPVSGKRVPKPKVPKGASPPPEGWTATMAVKGNARVLAASNGTASGSGGSSSAGHTSRKRGSNQPKHSANSTANNVQQATVPGKAQIQSQPVSPASKIMICVYCLKQIKGSHQAYTIDSGRAQSYICMHCVQPGNKAAANLLGATKGQQTGRGHANGIVKKQDKELVEQNVNGDVAKATNDAQNGDDGKDNDNDGLLEIEGGELEQPGALPPDQLLSDEQPYSRAGNKITPKPLEVVVINGRKAIAIAGEPPRPQLQVVPRDPFFGIHEKRSAKRNSTPKEKRQCFIECLSAGNQSCQVMLAVMKTLDQPDRVRMANVCKTWAMIGRDRSVWRTLKLRNAHISNWVLCMRDMMRHRTHELDMMGVKMDNPKMRMEGDLRILKSLRILRTDACEAEFIQAVIKRLPRLLQLRATCTSRVLNLSNIEKMVDLQVLRLRMTDPRAGLISLQPLQKLDKLRELSLRGINNMVQLELVQLQGLKQLETLVLGACRGMKVFTFGKHVLPNLKRLRHLRLENHHSNRSFNITEIMEGLAASGTVKRLELINVNVDAEFSHMLAACKSVQELLLMPNFHNNTAYMMHYVIQAINENCEQLNVFRLGLTFELLSVTRALATNQEKDCIPVALPIPGVPDNDILNESDEPIAYLPVDRLESILHHMMPQAWLTVAKVSQSETTNLQFLAANPTDSADGSGTVTLNI